ncbi:hypothetical protein BDP27DRAFT_1318976 [Rhodocollybia butyracea]|uniref:Uncharacterized protein n=1 Tax=Rhodocollybia butyracea TaxID=206335 RepID=A0A9P5Q301_9AGAR|nr:hypothetical protein BDP27DRAFT_1318976 [Rhodocollybia butyracea]
MLLSHHWLCLVLLTILISPSYAAPTPPAPPLLPAQPANIAVPYTVKVVNKENGGMIETVTGAVANRVISLMKELDHFRNGQVKLTNVVRSSQTENPSKMAMDYFEVLGGPVCLISGDCYGYVVTTKTKYGKQDMRIGAVVIHHKNPESFTVDDYMPSRYVNQRIAVENHREKYLEFLRTLKPIETWKNAMANANGAQVHRSEQSKLRDIEHEINRPATPAPDANAVAPASHAHAAPLSMARPLPAGRPVPPSSARGREPLLSAGRRLPPLPAIRPLSRPLYPGSRLAPLQGLGTRPPLSAGRRLPPLPAIRPLRRPLHPGSRLAPLQGLGTRPEYPPGR